MQIDSFDDLGFLSKETQGHIQNFSKTNATLREIYYQICNFSHEIRKQLPSFWKGENAHVNIHLSLLYVRMISNYEGIWILAERGMQSEVEIISRSMFEANVTIRAIINNPSISDRLMKEGDGFTHKQLLNNMLKSGNQKLREYASELLQEYTIGNRPNNKISFSDLLKEAKAEEEGFIYSVLSMASHANLRSLETMLLNDEKRRGILFGPMPIDNETMLSHLNSSMLLLVETIKKLNLFLKFENSSKVEIDLNDYFNRIQSLPLPVI